MNDRTVLVEETIHIAAARDVVFELLSTARGLCEWMAVEAECDAVVGGVVRWRHENGAVMSGRIVAIDAPSRIAFTYGWESGGPDVPAGSTLVEITLEDRAGETELRLVHSKLPSPQAEEHRYGWRWFLGRLAARAAGTTPREDCIIDETETER